MKWSLFESDKSYENSEHSVVTTFELILWLLFAIPEHIVVINLKRKK